MHPTVLPSYEAQQPTPPHKNLRSVIVAGTLCSNGPTLMYIWIAHTGWVLINCIKTAVRVRWADLEGSWRTVVVQ